MSFDFAGECAAKYHKKVYLSDFELTWHMLQPHVTFETFVAQGDGELLVGLGLWGYNGLIPEIGAFQSGRLFLIVYDHIQSATS